MLAFLKVKDFALIDELQVEFGEGFNVITGETGAGKSIIINALSTLMNARAAPDLVRTGAQQAEIIGHFLLLKEEYVLKRIISVAGRSRGFLNGEPVTLARLEGAGCSLINIYGQNEFQSLLDKDSYIAMIDDLLHLAPERESLTGKVERLKGLKAQLGARNKEAEGREKETSFLEYQISEIEKADLKEGEEEGIKERLRCLKDAEKIKKSLAAILDELYESDQSVQGALMKSMQSLKQFLAVEAVERLRKRIESMSFDLQDLVSEMKGLEKALLYDPEEAQRLEDRLSLIYGLKSKYGKSIDDIRAHKKQAEERRVYLTGLSEVVEGLERESRFLEADISEQAARLSLDRKKGSSAIERAITGELALLSMKGVEFRIAITDKDSVDETGKDDVDLLIATNPGEPLKPLRRIASGGELSRIMLAIKRVIGGEERKTLIFDEVDAGIGGGVADMVGKRLKELARTHQVLCITHLPQIAVYGDHHFQVEKHYGHGTTRTVIRRLSAKERVTEVARMMGGATITEKTLLRAEEMLQNG
jgi:DNA repair protein RecN (Recombination protein N)